MEKQNIQDEEIRFDILRQYIPYWPLFVLLTIFSLSGAWLYLRYKKPVYQVNAKILVKDEKKGLDDSQVLDALNIFAEKKIVENETDIIRSWPLLEEVVKDLKLYTSQWSSGKIRGNRRDGSDAPSGFTRLTTHRNTSLVKTPFSV